jgi:hypothetical protein
MIRVTVELLPHGDEYAKHTLATMKVVNAGPTTNAMNGLIPDERLYAVSMTDKEGTRLPVSVTHRRSAGWGPLVKHALAAALNEVRYER